MVPTNLTLTLNFTICISAQNNLLVEGLTWYYGRLLFLSCPVLSRRENGESRTSWNVHVVNHPQVRRSFEYQVPSPVRTFVASVLNVWTRFSRRTSADTPLLHCTSNWGGTSGSNPKSTEGDFTPRIINPLIRYP